jgi:hypothetical protein
MVMFGSEASADACRNRDRFVSKTIHDTLMHNPSISIEKLIGSEAQKGQGRTHLAPPRNHGAGAMIG